MKAVQDFYPDHFAQCYGCGSLNPRGLQIKTHWKGTQTLTSFIPSAHHTAIPGFVYGGLLASLIDCHGTGSASLALAREKGISLEGHNAPRCVTASLQVDYLKPTPLGPELQIYGNIVEVKGRKVIVEAELYAGETLCVKGRIVALEVPENFGA